MKIRYPFHWRSVIRVGPIMATKKFHSQFAEIPMAFLVKVSFFPKSVFRSSGRVVECHAASLQGAGVEAQECGMGWGGDVEGQSTACLHAYPFVRTCMGKSSGPYTHGTQFVDAPKMSMNRKKNATDALPASFSSAVP